MDFTMRLEMHKFECEIEYGHGGRHESLCVCESPTEYKYEYEFWMEFYTVTISPVDCQHGNASIISGRFLMHVTPFLLI